MKPIIKTLICDDESPARKELRYHVEKYEHIQVLGEATNAKEALELASNIDYALVFLDISMPGECGLELSEKINSLPNPPAIIFVTGHDNFGVEAFNANAVDYILKPINPDRLDKAIKKLEATIGNNTRKVPANKEGTKEIKAEPLNIIPIDHEGKIILVHEEDILFVHASNDYTYLKTKDKKYITRFTLKELENRLSSSIFYRCHRSYLVNLNQTVEVISYNGTFLLGVDDKEKSEIPVSRSQTRKIKDYFGL